MIYSQDGNFTKAEVMPAKPPVSVVGQSSFVDFGEKSKDLSFSVIFDIPTVFLCACDRLIERSILNLAPACTVGIWFVIGELEPKKNTT